MLLYHFLSILLHVENEVEEWTLPSLLTAIAIQGGARVLFLAQCAKEETLELRMVQDGGSVPEILLPIHEM